MKVLAINGSPRRDGNTAILLKRVLAEIAKEGIETELVQLAGRPLRGCTACYQCYERKDRRCAIAADGFNECFEKMCAAEGILLGSPTYVADITAEMKALIDRACLVSRANGNLLMRKAGAAVLAVRRAGSVHAFDSINHFFTITQMIIPGSNYWNLGIGREVGEVESDAEGLATMETLGRNMAWLIKRIAR